MGYLVGLTEFFILGDNNKTHHKYVCIYIHIYKHLYGVNREVFPITNVLLEPASKSLALRAC